VTVAVIDSGCSEHYALPHIADRRNFSADDTPLDTVGHGTHVCGIIGGRLRPCKGIAPKADIHSLKVLGTSGSCTAEAVADAVIYAMEIKADLVCMSLGSTRANDRLHTAIQQAVDAGVVVVAAAGNDGGAVNFPAGWQETVAVGAVDKQGKACMFSSRGSEIICAAPGEDIQSTWLANGFATVSGTSMAAPFVVGVLALYISQLHRRPTHHEVVKALQDTSRDVGPPGPDDAHGWGLVDPHKLMDFQVKPQDGVTIWIPGAKVL